MMKKVKIMIVLVFITSVGFGQNSAINSKVFGKGKPIVFLPGFTCPGSVWDETVANLECKNEVHLISYAGFNGNEPIEMPWYESIKDELILYIKDNKLKDVQIVGHSMGGSLALDIAAALPSQIRRMLLVDAIPNMHEIIMPEVPVESLIYDSPYNLQMIEMDDDEFKSMAEMMASNMTLSQEKIPLLTQWILEADRETYVYGFTDLLKLDLTIVLPQIKAKTLILGASFPDVETAKSNFEKQYAGLSNKTIEMVSDTKHFIMFDQPEWFYKKVNAFLADEF
jgi:pimeloyl-ACP methyl ester carboxylesterase